MFLRFKNKRKRMKKGGKNFSYFRNEMSGKFNNANQMITGTWNVAGDMHRMPSKKIKEK